MYDQMKVSDSHTTFWIGYSKRETRWLDLNPLT